MTAKPPPSYTEIDRMICAPGSLFEMEETVLHGRACRVWKNAPPDFRTFFIAQLERFADRVIINEPVPEPAGYDDRRDITYGQLLEDAYRLAAWMREQGVDVGDRVAIGGHNTAGWVTSFVAINLIGAVPVCLNSTLIQDVQIHCITLTRPKLVLVDAKDAEILGPVADKLRDVGVLGVYSWNDVQYLPAAARAGVKGLADIRPSAKSVDDVRRGAGFERVKPGSDALILFTSGTTSLPKGVLITQQGGMQHVLTASIPAMRAALRRGAPLEMVLAAHQPPPQQLVVLMPVPLFHVTGLLATMIRIFVGGAKMIFMRRWSVPDAAKLVVRYNVRMCAAVPAIFTALLQSGLLPPDYSFDTVSFGGAPPPKRLAGDCVQRFPNAYINHGWGMTEAAGLFIALGGPDLIQQPEAVGLAIPIGDMRIVDMTTREPVPPNTLGVLQIRGGNMMKEYLDNPKANAEAFTADGWFDTGDVGLMNEEGLLFLRDRAKDMIIRGGENIASAEVENAVTQDPRIALAAAVPVPDPVLGERVGLGVSLAPGVTATAESIMAEAEKRLRHPARPVIVVIFPEGLPLNANGKIVKNDVKEVVVAQWEKQGGVPAGGPRARL